jgi:hypothetical protein
VLLTIKIWLLHDYLQTVHRMHARVKFVRDFEYYRSKDHTLQSAYFLARNTL